MPEPGEGPDRPQAAPGRRPAVLVVVGLLVVVVAGVTLQLVRHHGSPARRPTAPAPTTTVVPPPAPTMPVPAATDALVPLGGSEGTTGGGHLTLTAQYVNGTSATLVLSGPVRLLGPDGRLVPHAAAKIVADRSPSEDTDIQALTAAPALSSIAPHQHVVLVLTVSYDCHRDASELAWPQRYPTVEIPFAGFDRPWRQGFDDLFGAVDPGLPGSGDSLLRGVCAGR